MSIEEKLEEIYKGEINIKIESFWDAGWYFTVGDKEANFEKLADGVDWLYLQMECLGFICRS